MSVDYVELKELEDSASMHAISKSALFHIHQTQLSKDKYNVINVNQLVVSLGGIDAILSHYLSPENSMQLSQLQLQSIHNIITAEQNSSNIIPEKPSFYTFSKSKTLIQQISNDSITEKLVNFVYSKTAAVILTIMACTLVSWWLYAIFIAKEKDDNYDYIWLGFDVCRLIFEIVMFFWAIMIILTVNIAALILSIKQFLFWFKLFQCLGFCITQWIIIEYFKIWQFTRIGTVAGIVFVIDVFCFVMIICALDSFYMPRKLKVLLSLVISILWTVGTLELILSAPTEDMTIVTVFNHWTFSVWSMYSDSLKVLSIFFWKQTIYLIIYPTKCVNIRKTPYYKWE